MRQGVSEVVYGAGKTAEQIAGVCRALVENGQERVLVTRLRAEKAAAVERALEGACPLAFAYRQGPRLGILGEAPEPDGNGPIVIAAAGTSDLPVAEEAAVTAEMLGNEVVRLYDVGVAGIHRLARACRRLSRGPASWWRWRAWRARWPAWWAVSRRAR